MSKVNLETSNYNRQEDIKAYIGAIEDANTKFEKCAKSSSDEVKKLETAIDKKRISIEKLERVEEELTKKQEELDALKAATKSAISDLEAKKKEVSYEDADVQKMEIEDIDSLISVKRGKIAKIDSKLTASKDKFKTNSGNLKMQRKELETLEKQREVAEESLLKTNDLVSIIKDASEGLIASIHDVLDRHYDAPVYEPYEESHTDYNIKPHHIEIPEANVAPIESEPIDALKGEEIILPTDDEPVSVPPINENDISLSGLETVAPIEEPVIDIDIDDDIASGLAEATTAPSEEPKNDVIEPEAAPVEEKEEPELIEPTVEEPKEEVSETVEETPEVSEPTVEPTPEPAVVDTPVEETIPAPPETIDLRTDEKLPEPEVNEQETTPQDDSWEVKPVGTGMTTEQNKNYLKDVFDKEEIKFDDFSDEDKEKLNSYSDRVVKNLVILKKHNIPLKYTINAASIYYNISPEDLEDLLNIITSDEEGNGMGYGIEYSFNVLKELSFIDVDKLIDVYNSEYMNINSKTGLIDLLKKTNPSLGDFETNRKANEAVLTSLGINYVKDISEKYPEFINLDHPLFENIIGLFDKDDLIEKLNADITVIPQILDYWKNN